MVFSFFRRRSPFAKALEAYGLSRCSVSPGQLWVGFPPSTQYSQVAIQAVPAAPASICFVEGPEQADLVAALAASPEVATLEHLMIGTTHDYIKPGRPTPYDFSAAVAALRGATMPALKRLSLGAMEKLFNGHGYYGRVGDITHIFEMAPGLEKLDVNGWFVLTRPVTHDRLESLLIDVDEIGVSGGPLSQETVTNILSSRLPRLRELQLALDADDVEPYDVPGALYGGNGLPVLEACFIDCLTPDAASRLASWKAERGIRW